MDVDTIESVTSGSRMVYLAKAGLTEEWAGTMNGNRREEDPTITEWRDIVRCLTWDRLSLIMVRVVVVLNRIDGLTAEDCSYRRSRLMGMDAEGG